MASSPKRQQRTAQEVALERRQRKEMDDEIAEGERRFSALSRGRLGTKSLLAAGAPRKSSQPAQPAKISMLGASRPKNPQRSMD